MTNKEKFVKLVDRYDEDLKIGYYKQFAPDVLHKCGSIMLKRIEDLLETPLYCYCYSYVIIDDVVFSADRKNLIRYSPEKTDVAYVIPSFVEKISDEAFQGCDSLSKITLSENINRIGNRAFSDCSRLSEVIWVTHEASGGSNVFADCPKLKTVITDDAHKLWGYMCDNDGSPFINGACLIENGEICENLSIPEGRSNVSLRSFQGCTSIKNIYFIKFFKKRC